MKRKNEPADSGMRQHGTPPVSGPDSNFPQEGKADSIMVVILDQLNRIESRLVTIENEMLTPSLKIRRHVINDKYGEPLEALYGG